ncbi:hypothetical protein HUK49_05050 [Limosilactobacillus sp. c11Ua_112_M]|uniref:hypothetical protein n=1 Tax=Limosilactobacillus TaxID=2742598 RepID=UPI001780E10A|nr:MULTISPECIES: hypothetical protein [Limosilactobacillus]MBD8087324.1 hypothetical protein [Limosilactobacillus portuensis]MEC4741804.1 hypothetical protein [Limosilactobacillus sp. c10Ua_36]
MDNNISRENEKTIKRVQNELDYFDFQAYFLVAHAEGGKNYVLSKGYVDAGILMSAILKNAEAGNEANSLVIARDQNKLSLEELLILTAITATNLSPRYLKKLLLGIANGL